MKIGLCIVEACLTLVFGIYRYVTVGFHLIGLCELVPFLLCFLTAAAALVVVPVPEHLKGDFTVCKAEYQLVCKPTKMCIGDSIGHARYAGHQQRFLTTFPASLPQPVRPDKDCNRAVYTRCEERRFP